LTKKGGLRFSCDRGKRRKDLDSENQGECREICQKGEAQGFRGALSTREFKGLGGEKKESLAGERVTYLEELEMRRREIGKGSSTL